MVLIGHPLPSTTAGALRILAAKPINDVEPELDLLLSEWPELLASVLAQAHTLPRTHYVAALNWVGLYSDDSEDEDDRCSSSTGHYSNDSEHEDDWVSLYSDDSDYSTLQDSS